VKSQLDKWLGYFAPLHRGRFDFSLGDVVAHRNAWHQGLAMTGGRFWTRIAGGHNLRRAATADAEANATMTEPIVGRSDGSADSVTTFPWVGHPANTQFRLALTAVGAGGVEDDSDAPQTTVRFDAEGDLVGPSPNAVVKLIVTSQAGGVFLLHWMYRESGQQAAPQSFRIYNDAATPGAVDYSQAVGSVTYRFRRGFFEWTSGPFADGQRRIWAVRAEAATGVLSPIGVEVLGIAGAARPPAPSRLFVGAAED